MRHVNVALFVPDEGCPHRCSFCNQKTISGKKRSVTLSDVDNAVKIALDSKVDTSQGEIAFFGGSFTAIEHDYMESLLSCAFKYVKSGQFRGIRISTRPDCIDREILTTLKNYGVTSIELGAQSMDDEVLFKNHRGHTALDTKNASALIREFGFELGLQMMTGLFSDTDSGAIFTANELIKLHPDTMRIYPTIVLKDTELCRLYLEKKYTPQSLDSAIDLCSKLLLMFFENDIPVIRLSLHSGGDVSEGYVAGPFHPAFRQLCESKIYYEKILFECEKLGLKKVNVFVPRTDLSTVLGQKRSNKEKLKRKGITTNFISSDDLSKYNILIQGA